jgi:hypothetical protein
MKLGVTIAPSTVWKIQHALTNPQGAAGHLRVTRESFMRFAFAVCMCTVREDWLASFARKPEASQ